MKIETEQALLGQESDMPGLSLLLDEQALLDVVQLQLPAADISRIRIDYLRYKPGTGCLAGLRVFDVLSHSQHAFARVLPRDNTQNGRQYGAQFAQEGSRHHVAQDVGRFEFGQLGIALQAQHHADKQAGDGDNQHGKHAGKIHLPHAQAEA